MVTLPRWRSDTEKMAYYKWKCQAVFSSLRLPPSIVLFALSWQLGPRELQVGLDGRIVGYKEMALAETWENMTASAGARSAAQHQADC